MDDVDRILEEGIEETVRRMLNRVVASESLTAAVEYKLVGELSKAIKVTGSDLFKASTALRDSTDESVKILKKSIDDFRKSNEKTSKVLIALTAVIGFATLVQAFYAIMLVLKK